MSGLLAIPPFEAMRLWGELVECFHGRHGFGGHKGEFYAYRFGREYPAATTSPMEERKRDIARAKALHSLLALFLSEYRADILVNGREFGDWVAGEPFQWRTHILVRPAPLQDAQLD